jgi:hypothetical protein
MRHVFQLFFLGRRQLYYPLECGLDLGQITWNFARPGYCDPGKGLGNEEAIPRAQLPGAFGIGVEGTDGAVGELGELRDAGLGHHRRATGAVGSNGAVAAGKVGAVEATQTKAAITRTGAPDSGEAETFDGAGNKFAVEATADKDADSEVAEAPSAGQQGSVPKGIDGRRRAVVTRGCTGLGYVFVPKGNAKTTDGHARDARDDGEGKALLQGIGGGHS